MTRTITTYRARFPDDDDEWQTTSPVQAEEWISKGAIVKARTRSVE